MKQMRKLYERRNELVEITKPVLEKRLEELAEKLLPVYIDTNTVKENLMDIIRSNGVEIPEEIKENFKASFAHKVNNKTYEVEFNIIRNRNNSEISVYLNVNTQRIQNLTIFDGKITEIHMYTNKVLTVIDLFAETLHNDKLYNLIKQTVEDKLEKLIGLTEELLEYEANGCAKFLENNKGFVLESGIGA